MSQTIKVVVLGLGAVGKSCLSIRFVQGTFVVDYEPTISNTYKKTITVDGTSYTLDILDTAGMETQESLKPTVYRDRDCFILVYAVNDRASYDAISRLHSDIQRYKEDDGFPCILCGNKVDLPDQQVTEEEGKELAENLKAKFLLTSAKTGHNVSEIMVQAVQEYMKVNKPSPDPKPDQSPSCHCNLL